MRPGAEVDATYDLLTEELLALRNDDTGRPAVREVIRCDDHYDGPRRTWLPDLFVAWDWSEPIRSRCPRRPSESSSASPSHLRTGDHRPAGLVLTRGLDLGAVRPVPIEDLARPLVAAVRARGNR